MLGIDPVQSTSVLLPVMQTDQKVLGVDIDPCPMLGLPCLYNPHKCGTCHISWVLPQLVQPTCCGIPSPKSLQPLTNPVLLQSHLWWQKGLDRPCGIWGGASAQTCNVTLCSRMVPSSSLKTTWCHSSKELSFVELSIAYLADLSPVQLKELEPIPSEEAWSLTRHN